MWSEDFHCYELGFIIHNIVLYSYPILWSHDRSVIKVNRCLERNFPGREANPLL